MIHIDIDIDHDIFITQRQNLSKQTAGPEKNGLKYRSPLRSFVGIFSLLISTLNSVFRSHTPLIAIVL